METPAHRIMEYVLVKMSDEPLRRRMRLCEDLACFSPDERAARGLRKQAQVLRLLERQTDDLRGAFSGETPL